MPVIVALGAQPTAVPAWAPTPAEVHQEIPRRAEFTNLSKPSLEDVQGKIDRAALSLTAEFTDLPNTLYPIAKQYVAYRVAAELEWAFEPEQQFGDNGPAQNLDRMAGAELARLRNLYSTGLTAGGGAFTIGRLPDTYAPGVVTPLGYFPAY